MLIWLQPRHSNAIVHMAARKCDNKNSIFHHIRRSNYRIQFDSALKQSTIEFALSTSIGCFFSSKNSLLHTELTFSTLLSQYQSVK